jgi:hypothetical protein
MHLYSIKIFSDLYSGKPARDMVTVFSNKISEFHFTPSYSLEVGHFYSFVVDFRGVSKIAKSDS